MSDEILPLPKGEGWGEGEQEQQSRSGVQKLRCAPARRSFPAHRSFSEGGSAGGTPDTLENLQWQIFLGGVPCAKELKEVNERARAI